MAEAQRDKERKYPELLSGQRCKLVITAMKVGGRWSEEAYYFVETLALARARDAPPALKGSVVQACKKRWMAMLAVAGMRSFANTLLEERATAGYLWEGECPTLGQFLEAEPHA